MVKRILSAACLMLSCTAYSQTPGSPAKSYIQVYGGIGFQGSLSTQQTGVAHKRGDFNAFDTDFDLHVKVNGESESALFTSSGLLMGQTWQKADRKWNPGFEIDVNRTTGKHNTSLANEETEEVKHVNGPNEAEVLAFVEEHYGAGHHTFSNSMKMETWNSSASLMLTGSLSTKLSLYTGLGFGISLVSMKDAESLQTSPTSGTPYENTTETGGPVNHYNSNPNSSSSSAFGQFRLGLKMDLSSKLGLVFDARGLYRGSSSFNFGSTQYSDHPPTDNWLYTLGKGMSGMFNLGIRVSM